MKLVIVKYVTALGLVAILLLQTVWLYNTYILLQGDIVEKSNNALENAIKQEALQRLQVVFESGKADEVMGGPLEEKGDVVNQDLHLQEALLKFGYPLLISRLDSLFVSKLEKWNIKTDVVLNHIQIKDKSIIQSIGSFNVFFLGSIKTKIIPIRQDKSEGIQAIILNPYLIIFGRMGLLLIATVFMMLFVAACIVYQIKVIFFQNKIAKLREDFSYAMVHDMKTPLSSIQLGLRLLYSNKQTGEKREKSFQIVEDEVAHLLALTNKVLTLSKMESGKLRLDNKKFRIAPVINDLIEKFSVKAGKETLFSTDIRQELVYGDEEFLKEAISNLIDNAIKYSGDSVRIDISVGSDDTYTWIRVKDNGFGISHQDQKKIFEKFERAAAIDRNRKASFVLYRFCY